MKQPLAHLCLITLMVLSSACAPLRIDAPVNPDWELRRAVLESIESWEFVGSISVRDGQDSHTSRIRWQQRDEAYVINLWGTLNIGATEITGQPGQVRIEQQGEEPIVTNSPEQLIYEQLGYELPVSQLEYWMKGIPAPHSRSTPEFGENNQLVLLEQDGWQINYLAYTNYGAETLPTRMRMEKPPLRLDLLRLNWTIHTPSEHLESR